MTRDEWLEEGRRRFGEDFMAWKFVCPICGHVQSVADFREYKDQGASPDSATFHCIGRYQESCRRAFGDYKEDGKPGPCDYTAGGLFRLAPVHIDVGTDEPRHAFAFAEAP